MRRINLTITFDLPSNQEDQDASFLDVETHSGSRVRGTYTCRPDEDLNPLERQALLEILHYTAANENVSEGWLKERMRRILNLPHLSGLKHGDFAQALLALMQILEV